MCGHPGLLHPEAAIGGVLQEKVFLENSQNSQENTCVKVSFLIKLQAQACNFIKKETLAQVFSYEFCKISKNTFFTEHLWATASVHQLVNHLLHSVILLFNHIRSQYIGNEWVNHKFHVIITGNYGGILVCLSVGNNCLKYYLSI